MTVDNLTIRKKHGVLRAQYDYYPYGLPWGMVEDVYNETAMTTEFNTNEWGIDGGLDMNYFEARFYDPVLARWHSNDPLEQFHSPYLAMCADPANFTDPDGRAGIPFLQDFMKTDLGMACEMFVSLAGMVSGTALLSNIGAIGGTIGNMVSGAISIGTTANSIKNMAQLANEGSKVGQGGSFNMSNELIGEINSHGNVGMSFNGSGNNEEFEGDPKKKQPSELIYVPIVLPSSTIVAPTILDRSRMLTAVDVPLLKFQSGENNTTIGPPQSEQKRIDGANFVAEMTGLASLVRIGEGNGEILDYAMFIPVSRIAKFASIPFKAAANGIGRNLVRITPKIAGQLNNRGWTSTLIQDIVDNAYTTRRSHFKGTGNQATAYYHVNGSYVVVDDVTNEVVQISKWDFPEWIPDASIINPYIPK